MDAKSQLIRELAEIYGIEDSYVDFSGKTVKTSEKTYIGILEALGVTCKSQKDLEHTLEDKIFEDWMSVLKPVYVVKSSTLVFTISINLPDDYNSSIHWNIETENGERRNGSLDYANLKPLEQIHVKGRSFIKYELKLPYMPDHGYHKLSIHAGSLGESFSSLIVVPEECFNPLINKEDSSSLKIWGPGIQLYTLKSDSNWGIGDYRDLNTLVENLHKQGSGIIGLNPLHSLDPSSPEDASPYFPSSRNFYNYLYIDIESIPEFQTCEQAKKIVLSEDFQNKLNTLRELELVDYTQVAELKLKILNIIYSYFKQHHIDKETYHYQEFEEFIKSQGEDLHYFALFKALNEHFKKNHSGIYGWQQWPQEYKDPKSKAVENFWIQNKERIYFYKYIQWLGHKQITEISLKSRTLCPPIGLYGDLAVGINPNGADAWMNQEAYSLKLSIGAPPDPCNLKGQNWGLASFNPFSLVKQAYRPFIKILQKNMQLGGALRIDHFMAFYRLFCFPHSEEGSKGAYLKFPLDDLLGILALESHRNKCLIIGEDLGTVPPIISERMNSLGIMSYKLMCFEKNNFGEFKPSNQYKQNALVSFSTHDLPTLCGFWTGRGIAIREELDLIPSKTTHKKMLKEGIADRELLLKILDKENLLPNGITDNPASARTMSTELIESVHAFLANTSSLLLIVQLEDILQQNEQVNLPGTTHDLYPNWRRKITVKLEEMFQDERIKRVFSRIKSIRGFQTSLVNQNTKVQTYQCEIPTSTYRLQFNKDFTFKDAIKLIPYLKELGVSHLYSSPLLKSHSESHHGYDVISHNSLNPELGTDEDFNELCEILKKNNLGLIVDIIPNHMANTHENLWWMDVLEHGSSSSFSKYFDIDWFPIKSQLTGKILLPILGSSYGTILNNGELKVEFKVEEGVFVLRYYDKIFPINPSTYPQILNYRIDILASRLGENNPNFLEYQSIINSLLRLPSTTETDNNKKTERSRETKILKLRLTNLCQNAHAIAEFIIENLETFNKSDESSNLKLLHNLLEKQVFRLAYWKVATEEINYRRFFDINGLVGLRMESLIVFWETHQFIFNLIAEGKIQGLRVDHPDGLYDPAGYFKQIQEEIAKFKSIAKISESQNFEEMPIYLVIEKILPAFERLPEEWKVHGTTGYEFCNALSGVFVQGENQEKIKEIYKNFTERDIEFNDEVYECKKIIMKVSLSSELNSLASALSNIAEANWFTRDYTLNKLRDALLEVVACFPVYRTYITENNISKKDKEYVLWAIGLAKKKSFIEDSSIFDFIQKVLLLEHGKDSTESYQRQVLNFTLRFQQFTGPVMAKGQEDTTFYRYNPLVSLNEVGADLRYFGCPAVSFHNQNSERAKRWPYSLLNTFTHDSKRSEDVRARINVISEIPDQWELLLGKLSKLNKSKKTEVNNLLYPSTNDEYFLYQTLLGSWPNSINQEQELESYINRIENYMLKATREAKENTSWLNPNEEYEQALLKFCRSVILSLNNLPNDDEFKIFEEKISWFGAINSLSQIILKITSPGVPDFYQGSEVWNYSLVDPDNRKKINFQLNQTVFNQIEQLIGANTKLSEYERHSIFSELMENYKDSRIKSYITSQTLHYRNLNKDNLSNGEYIPLEIVGEHSQSVLSFIRKKENQICLVAVPLFLNKLQSKVLQNPIGEHVWKNTRIILPDNFTENYLLSFLSGEMIDCRNNREIEVYSIFKHLPFALLTNSF